MNDEQFDRLARESLDFDAGLPSRSGWENIRPVRWTWVPTVREILICGCAAGLGLVFVGIRLRQARPGLPANPMIQGALLDETRSVVASVTRIPDGLMAPAQGGRRSL